MNNSPIVKVTGGRVQGRTVNGVSSFLGIPYAAAPVGEARFDYPRPVEPWDGVRPAVNLGAMSTQDDYPPALARLLGKFIIPGDDCLNVNVWTPDPSARDLPVMVWIHGGAFTRGGNGFPLYDGTAFARDGVVIVNVNYRLGVAGFAVVEGAPDNRGLLDQISALQWVQDNIRAFGGNPDNVTIFGESAGGMSVATLLVSPAARGLFAKAIVQSGNGTTAANAEDARKVTGEIAAALGVPPTAAAFADVDSARLLEAQTSVGLAVGQDPNPGRWGASILRHGLGMMSLFPTIDAAVMPEVPVDALAAGAARGIPLLIGYTAEEFRLFTEGLGISAAITPETLPFMLSRYGLNTSLAETYSVGRPDAGPADIFSAIITDYAFRDGSMEIADVHSKSGTPTYAYEFAWRSEVLKLGACHALEIPFVFDTLAIAHPLTGPTPPEQLADRMHAAWIAFAETDNPGWQPFDPDARAVMIFDDPDSAVAYNPRAAELEELRAQANRSSSRHAPSAVV